MTNTTPKNVPADSKTVRAYFNENPNKVPDGDKTVGPKSAGRGRISQPARAVFAKETGVTEFYEKPSKGKTEPQTVTLTYRHTQPSGRKVKKSVDLTMTEVRGLLGPEAPQRGRLSAASLEAAGEAYAASLKK